MINKINITLVLLLCVVSCASAGQINNKTLCEKESEHLCCGDGTWGVFLPDSQGNPAPNIYLMNLQYRSNEDKCGRAITTDEIKAINKDVMPAAATAFGDSKAQFEVMVRFTLTPDQSSTAEMRYKDAGPNELPHLESFYKQLQALTTYRVKKGTIYVLFHYGINKGRDNTKSSDFSRELSRLAGKTVLEPQKQFDWQAE
jgi:hypothetical protein